VDVLVVGAGVAGLACARALGAAGARVLVVDKGRRPGGRASTRRLAQSGSEWRLDHGAQFVRCASRGLAEALDAMRSEGLVAPWSAPVLRIGPDGAVTGDDDARARQVPVGGMSGLCAYLARGVEVRCSTLVAALEVRGDAVRARVRDAAAGSATAEPRTIEQRTIESATIEASCVVVTAPAPQAAALVGAADPALAARAARAQFAPCLAAMAVFPGRADADEPGALAFASGPLAWAARAASRPGIAPGRVGAEEAWVLHASAAYSRAHLEDPPEAAAAALVEALGEVRTGALGRAPLPAPVALVGHRWRYALVEEPVGDPCLRGADGRLVIAGDGCLGARIDAAFESGLAAAAALGAG
jgi:predicted NAD/FAD-dependent oxidoreductase